MADIPPLAAPNVLRAIARERGITQTSIARAIGVNQSQVSRMLASDALPATPAAHKLCEWVLRTPGRPTAGEVLKNTELVAAMAFTWDGSPQHAAALSAVIRSLRVLGPHSKAMKQED